jgi:ABC-2 type transport system ATP-binding protein
MIRSLKADNVAVLLSSHLLERVQTVCDRVALFNRGRIALLGTVSELATTVFGGDTVIELEAEHTDVPGLLARVPDVRRVTQEGPGRFRLWCARDVRAEAAAILTSAGARLLRLNLLELSLEAIYTHYFEEHRDAA